MYFMNSKSVKYLDFSIQVPLKRIKFTNAIFILRSKYFFSKIAIYFLFGEISLNNVRNSATYYE